MPEKPRPIAFVIDDEMVIASTLAAILKTSGFAAVAFSDPREALRAAESQPPLLVISDVIMPEMNGIELAVQFKSKYPNCKILLFSGQAATVDLLESERTEGHDFVLLEKPIHPSDLLAAIKKL
jgi:DNA-binding NtrC family response regulator